MGLLFSAGLIAGEAIVGELTGKRLTFLPAQIVGLGEFAEERAGLVLVAAVAHAGLDRVAVAGGGVEGG